jgi:outer membrane beta-barrel protein
METWMALSRKGLCILLGIVALGLTSLVCRTASAADDAEEVATYAVQRRLFREGLELNAGLGFLPLNAFYKGFAVEGSVTYHFSTTWGWEIAEGGYVFAKTSTGLQQQLLNNFGVQPTQLPNAEFLGSSNILFTPFYGKLAGLNHSLSHLEILIPFGLALGLYQNPQQVYEGLDLGLGLRWFLSTHTSLRLEARDFFLTPGFSPVSLTQELFVTLGLSVAFGGPDR